MQCEPDKMLAVGFDQRKRVKNWLTRCGDLTEKFRRLDTNGDGLISANELRVLADTGEIYQSTVKAIIALADTDNDGNISLAELLQLGTILQENEKLKSELGVVEQASVASILPRVGEVVIAGFKDTYERRLRCHPSVHTANGRFKALLQSSLGEVEELMLDDALFAAFYESLDLKAHLGHEVQQEVWNCFFGLLQMGA